jgi:hypothetical protein
MIRIVAAGISALLIIGGPGLLSAPVVHADPPDLCQYQLADKAVTVPCGTCDDVLAEPGMAGNIACAASPPAAPVQSQPPQGEPPAAGPPATSDPAQLSPAEQQYINDLAVVGIQPTSTAKNLANTGRTICEYLAEAYTQYPYPTAGPGLKDGAASMLRNGNSNLTWPQAHATVQAAVNNLCPDHVTGMHFQ